MRIILITCGLVGLFIWIIFAAVFDIETRVDSPFAWSHILILASPALLLSTITCIGILISLKSWIYRTLIVVGLIPVMTYLSWVAIVFLTIAIHGL